MVTLFISLYQPSEPSREIEIVECLVNNVSNKYIDKIIILNEGFYHPILLTEKINNIQIEGRPNFSQFYSYLNKTGINIIANNDIKFDFTLGRLKYLFLKKGDMLSLTRHEKNGFLMREKESDSQDVWMFKGVADCLKTANFQMGQLGCDGRLNFVFYKGGYRVLNPSKFIKVHHEHTSPNREYVESDRLKGPYLLLKPLNLLGFYWNRSLLYLINKRRAFYFFDN